MFLNYIFEIKGIWDTSDQDINNWLYVNCMTAHSSAASDEL